MAQVANDNPRRSLRVAVSLTAAVVGAAIAYVVSIGPWTVPVAMIIYCGVAWVASGQIGRPAPAPTPDDR